MTWALSAATARSGLAASAPARTARAVPSAEPLRQILAAGPSGLLAVGASGALWALSPLGAAPRRLAEGLDPATPLANGHDRLAARTADGGLWVWERGESTVTRGTALAVHAGMLILPLAVIAVTAVTADQANGDRTLTHRLVRLEPDASRRWRTVARSADPVLPDARPLQADLDGRGDGGHVVVLAGPDGQRYQHGVLGDTIEATRLLWLERHSLKVLREITLPAPFVFEDIAPRAVPLPAPTPAGAPHTGLLTMRAGPEGVRLALVTADPARAGQLQLAALGDTVGGRHRWLAPTTDGQRWLAVHTPHIGGVLHEYRLDAGKLVRRSLFGGISTHHIGSRELDLAVWQGKQLWLPSQDGRQLHVFNVASNWGEHWAEEAVIALPGRIALTTALAGHHGMAALLDDGQVVFIGGSGR